MISPYLVQIMEPSTLTELGLDVSEFQVIAIKSRVHFRRGFDDSGFAGRSCWLNRRSRSSVRCGLMRWPMGMSRLSGFYPYGDPKFIVGSRA